MHEPITLPLTNPVFIFTVVLLIILLIPMLLNKLKIPHIVGLILAGGILGPYGINLIERDASVILFGAVGILYLMFLAGLEIDLNEFKKNKNSSIAFGLFTFIIPMILGTIVSYYVLNTSLISSVLIASMFASHTLISYPIVTRFGIKNKIINLTVGGTIIVNVLALLVLAVIVASVKGDISVYFWMRLVLSLIVFMLIMIYVIPRITRNFLKKETDEIARYIYILTIAFVSSVLSMLAGVEPIIGAFMAGLAVNRFVPRSSPLMNRIEFFGNALFIPYFLIGIGMLINFKVFVSDLETIKVGIVMTLVATLGKYFAAAATQKTFNLSKNDRLMIFGLSNGQAAATLAAVVIGYNIILGKDSNGEEIRLLSEAVLNGTIIMILITCSIASIATYRSAVVYTKSEITSVPDEPVLNSRFIIPVSNPATLPFLMELGMSVFNKKRNDQLFVLSVISDSETNNERLVSGKKMLDEALKIGASGSVSVEPLIRFDLNVANGIIYSTKEAEATDLILGLHHKQMFNDSFFGNLTQTILASTTQALYIYKPIYPISVIERVIIVIPENAEFETGFYKMLKHLLVFKTNIQAKVIVFATENTFKMLNDLKLRSAEFDFSLHKFTTWGELSNSDFQIIETDLLVAVSARKNTISYSEHIELIPKILNNVFNNINALIIYPEQLSACSIGESKSEILFDENFADQGRILYKLGSYMNRFLKK